MELNEIEMSVLNFNQLRASQFVSLDHTDISNKFQALVLRVPLKIYIRELN